MSTDRNVEQLGLPDEPESRAACPCPEGHETTNASPPNRHAPRCPMCTDDPCEFCYFLEKYGEVCRERGEPDTGFQAAKIVRHMEDGSEELLAWVPFHEGKTIGLRGSDELHSLKHWMVLLAEPSTTPPGSFDLVQILNEGV